MCQSGFRVTLLRCLSQQRPWSNCCRGVLQQVAAQPVLNGRGMGLPQTEPTMPSSRSSLTFPILGNTGAQPGMRQLRIVPAPAAPAAPDLSQSCHPEAASLMQVRVCISIVSGHGSWQRAPPGFLVSDQGGMAACAWSSSNLSLCMLIAGHEYTLAGSMQDVLLSITCD